MDQLVGLRVFCRVVERGSFSAVARELGISQPNASRHVAALEQRMGARLLVRTTRKVSPTDAGRAFYERASRALSELSDAESEVVAGVAVLAGSLRVAAPGAFGRRFVLPVVNDFIERHPKVDVELLLSDRPIDLVSEAVDLAVRIAVPGFASLTHRTIATLGLQVVAAPSYVARRGAPKSVADSGEHDAVLHTDSRQRMLDLVSAGALPALPAFHVRLLSDDIEAVHHAALAGLGLAPLPDWLIEDDLRAGRLVPILSELVLPETPVFVVFPAGRRHSARVRAFVDALGDALSVRLRAGNRAGPT